MTELEQLIESVQSQADVEVAARCRHLLQALADNQMAAKSLWQEALQHACGEAQRFTFVLWFGAERAKALHCLHLEQRRLGQELTELSGIEFSDSMGIIDSIDVVQAYAQSGEETSGERAAAALQTLADRNARLMETAIAITAS